MKDYIERAMRSESRGVPGHLRDGMFLSGLMERIIDVGTIADTAKKSIFYDHDLERLAPADIMDTVQVSSDREAFYKREVNERLLHAGLGMLTEAVEFLEALHKAAQKGITVDYVNLKEELGDNLWYTALAMDELGTTFEAEQKRNIDKLELRYENQEFDQEAANNRDLKAERESLERD